jgi:L-amino acid N-acyltransferase YncA
MGRVKFRLAETKDVGDFLDIYRPFVDHTAVSFDFEITYEVMEERFKRTTEKYPWIVCEVDGIIAGYAYASYFKERAGYTWTVEQSVYVREDFRRQHIATALYTCLREILKLQGYYSVIVIIVNSNIGSVNFHKHFGFEEVGVIKNAGFKMGNWCDRLLLVYSLRKHDSPPVKPKKIGEISKLKEFNDILRSCEKIVLVPKPFNKNETFIEGNK